MPKRVKDSQIESKRFKTVHSVNINVFVHATENEDKVLNALKIFLPDNFKVQKERATGHYQNPIGIFTVKIERARDIINFLDLIKRNLPKNDINKLLNDLERYVNDEGVLFIRFDKQQAMRSLIRFGKDDPILVRVKVAAYPASKEKALEVARGLLRDD